MAVTYSCAGCKPQKFGGGGGVGGGRARARHNLHDQVNGVSRVIACTPCTILCADPDSQPQNIFLFEAHRNNIY